VRQSGFVRTLSEPVAEACRREGSAELGDEEGLDADQGRGRDGRCEWLRDGDLHRGAGLGLGEGEALLAVAGDDHGGAEADDIGASLRGVEQQRESEARLGAERVMGFEADELVLGPRVKALCPDRIELDAEGRIVATEQRQRW